MRFRLQLACQLLFLSTIASSAQTPPRTTDATINENQSVEESVEDWFLSNYLEETMEDTMTLYPHPMAEANIHPTVDAMGTDEHLATVGEAWKYPMEGSSDANQSVEASMEDVMAMYQHATAETTRPLTIDATWILDEAFNYAKEVSFQTAETNDVPLDYQNTVEANQAQTIQAWLDQEQATVDVEAPSMLAMHVSAVNTRNAPPATGRCHSCNISESPYWCSGPDGACTLCNLCGGEESNSWKKQALAEDAELQALAEYAELKRLERSIGKMPTSYFDVSHSALAKYGNVASSSTSPHESGHTLPRLEGLPNVSFILQSPPYQNHAEGSRNGDGVEGSMERWTTMYQPATAEANHIDATCLLPAVPLSPCFSAISQFPLAHTPQRLPASSDKMIAASSFPGIPTLQTSKGRRTLSMTRNAIRMRKRRGPGRGPGRGPSKPLSMTPEAISARERRAKETPEMHTARLAKVKAYDAKLLSNVHAFKQLPPTQPNKRRKLTKEK